ncbi:hypothetical protein V6N11_068397 [Hibiscus sabdariffa]|uniref:F-box domain-containing protein n=1 Tax=Hibiscus sabdariffa TaxID=183260 RepID=A0ABR1ZCX6_9ROSI
MERNLRVGRLDRLSSLPIKLILNIVKLLPIQEAVRTSVLSSKWRRLFSLLSTFDLYDVVDELSPENYENFFTFVDKLLSNSQLDFEIFKLSTPGDVDSLRIDRWLAKSLNRCLKELVLGCRNPYLLPAFVFCCQTLTSLKFDISGGNMSLPASITVPSLNVLEFRNFVFLDVCSDLKKISSLIF